MDQIMEAILEAPEVFQDQESIIAPLPISLLDQQQLPDHSKVNWTIDLDLQQVQIFNHILEDTQLELVD
jgi:hypothetical protein